MAEYSLLLDDTGSRRKRDSCLSHPRVIVLLFLTALGVSIVFTAVGVGIGYTLHKARSTSPSPPPPSSCPAAPAVPAFGDPMRSCYFPHLQKGWTFLNHGSYGAAPSDVLEAVETYRLQSQANADLWFRQQMVPLFVMTRTKVAEYVGASSVDSIVLVDDATEGINAVVRSLALPEGTRVLRTSFAYLMVQNVVDYMISERWRNVTLQVVTLPWPNVTDADATAMIESAIESEDGRNISLLVLDHISSSPMMVFDVERLAKAVKKRSSSALVLVDGAHAFGQVPINLTALEAAGVDYYTGNGHKWLCSERGSAFLFAAETKRAGIHPAVISNRYTAPDKGWPSEFNWRGTRDYSALIGLQEALEVRHRVGDEEWRAYNDDLCGQAANHFRALWPNSTLPLEGQQFHSMVNVGPVQLRSANQSLAQLNSFLFDTLHYSSVPYTVNGIDDQVYFRLSCQIYNYFEEYVRFGDVVNAFLEGDGWS